MSLATGRFRDAVHMHVENLDGSSRFDPFDVYIAYALQRYAFLAPNHDTKPTGRVIR